MEEGKTIKLCSYAISMLLKKLGFNEPCDYLYTTAIRHNGEDLGSDEQFELEAEGHGDEIEHVPGGWLEEHYNRNDFDYFSEETCSAPWLHDVVDWFEDYNFIISAEPVFGLERVIELHTYPKYIFKGWQGTLFDIDSSELFCVNNIRENRYEAIADGIEKALGLLDSVDDD